MSQFLIPGVAFATAACLSAVGTWAMRRWSLARGFIDRPGGHKGHLAGVALGGGVPVVLAVVLPIVVGAFAARWLSADSPEWLPGEIEKHLGGIVDKTPIALQIVLATLLMCGLGLYDDARPMKARSKFAGQLVLAVFLVVQCDLRLLSHWHFVPSALLSILWIVGVTNSFNFLDNMDGLAGGVALISAGVFAITAMLAGQLFVPTCCWLLVGALAGFLPFNVHPASIFLGDAGSLSIGLLVSVFTILTTFADPAAGQRPFGVYAPLVVLAVPLYDTASVMLLRWRAGAPIWTGDRRHFSHRLVRRGMGVRQAVVLIWLATLLTALPALLLPKSDWLVATAIAVYTLLIVFLVGLMERLASHDEPAG
ncbi:MAG: MraY family glycosyltransferase [Planctomycetota bacterium]|nr:MraY family glycosyltransferase [Planctomycetota bacterium]